MIWESNRFTSSQVEVVVEQHLFAQVAFAVTVLQVANAERARSGVAGRVKMVTSREPTICLQQPDTTDASQSPDRHATYIMAASVAGASRSP